MKKHSQYFCGKILLNWLSAILSSATNSFWRKFLFETPAMKNLNNVLASDQMVQFSRGVAGDDFLDCSQTHTSRYCEKAGKKILSVLPLSA